MTDWRFDETTMSKEAERDAAESFTINPGYFVPRWQGRVDSAAALPDDTMLLDMDALYQYTIVDAVVSRFGYQYIWAGEDSSDSSRSVSTYGGDSSDTSIRGQQAIDNGLPNPLAFVIEPDCYPGTFSNNYGIQELREGELEMFRLRACNYSYFPLLQIQAGPAPSK